MPRSGPPAAAPIWPAASIAHERAQLGPDCGLGAAPKKSAQLAEATITWSVAGSIASRQPWGWIEPGMWIGSRWQLSRSTGSPVGR